MSAWLYISVLLLTNQVGAQQENHHVAYLTSEISVVTGQQTIEIYFEVEEGFHIQSNAPSNDSLIPTALKVEGMEDAQIAGVVFPDPHEISLSGSDDKMEVFDGRVSLTLLVEFNSDEERRLPAQLCYQACDNRKCFFPRCLDFTLVLTPKVHK